MPPAAPDPSQFHVETDLDVRWGDLDALGHVNNSRFFTYFEQARTAYLARVAPDLVLSPTGPGIILARTWCDFFKPVGFPAVLRLGCRTVRMGGKSWEVEHLVRGRDDGEVHAVGGAVLVWYDFTAGRPAPLPESIRRRVAEVEGREFVA